MTLKMSEVCRIWHLTYLNLYDRQRLPDPSSDSQSLQDSGHRNKWFHLDYGNANHCKRLLQCLACSQGSTQTIVDKQSIEELIAPLCLDKVSSLPPFLLHRKTFSSSEPGGQGCYPNIPASSSMEPTVAWDNCPDKELWTSLCHFGCPSQVSDPIDGLG